MGDFLGVRRRGRRGSSRVMEVIKWSEEEQKQLDTAMKKFPADKCTPLGRYIKMSSLLPQKNVRDVALRVKWLSKRDLRKKKKGAGEAAGKKWQQNSARQDKKEKDAGRNIEYAPITQLLEQNLVVIKQIQQNMMQNKVHENTELLSKFRDNILEASNTMNSMTGMMEQMPQMPQINTSTFLFQ